MENYVAPEELAKYLPIDRGDSVLVASDVTYLCWLAYREGKVFDMDRLIDCMQERSDQRGHSFFPHTTGSSVKAFRSTTEEQSQRLVL